MEQLYQLEHNILEILEIGGKSIANTSALPTQREFKVIQEEYETKVISNNLLLKMKINNKKKKLERPI